MREQAEYQDIARDDHLQSGPYFSSPVGIWMPVYASTLAEWLDVGQVNNP